MPNRSRNRGRSARVERGMPMGRAQTPVRARPVQEDPVVVLAETITASDVASNLHNTIKQLRERIKELEKTIKSKNKEISLSDGLVRKVEALERKLHNKEVADEYQKNQYLKKKVKEMFGKTDLFDLHKIFQGLVDTGILITTKDGLTPTYADGVVVSKKSLKELYDDGYTQAPLPDTKTRDLPITCMWVDKKIGSTNGKDIIKREYMNINDWSKDRKMCEEMMEQKDNEIKKLKAENEQLKKQIEDDDLLFQDVNQ